MLEKPFLLLPLPSRDIIGFFTPGITSLASESRISYLRIKLYHQSHPIFWILVTFIAYDTGLKLKLLLTALFRHSPLLGPKARAVLKYVQHVMR